MTYWKRSAESVTAWLNRYEDDPFFRTEVHVVSLLLSLGIISIGTILFLYDLNTGSINAAIASVNAGTSPEEAGSAIQSLAQIRTARLLFGISGMLAFFVLFGYLTSVVALQPARNALKAQKRFIRNIAHELRTPLSIIKTNSEIALLDPEVDKSAKGVLCSNIEELDRISDIINNMLTLSALSRPDRTNFAAVDLARIVQGVTGKYETLARACQVRTMLFPCSESLVWGNATALDQIASNILKNAILYTPASGTISISVSPTPSGEVELKVSDTGIGMSPAELDRIFEPFYRADASRTRSSGLTGYIGSGIGLTIVSELVRMHQGSISVQSAQGEGTSVTVRLRHAPLHTLSKAVPTRPALGAVSLDFSDQISGVRS